MKKIGLLFIIGSLSFWGCGTSAGEKQVDGKTIYNQNCLKCHGDDGKANIMGAADLTISKLDKEMTFLVIKEGKNAMTGFFSVLNDDQIHAVMDYIEKMKK